MSYGFDMGFAQANSLQEAMTIALEYTQSQMTEKNIRGSKDGEATTYKDTNANSIAAGKCKFVAKNSGILFV